MPAADEDGDGEEEDPASFTGRLAGIRPTAESYEVGQIIAIRVNVLDANMDYRIQWEQKPLDEDEENAEWTAIPGAEGDELVLEASMEITQYTYRACLTAEDGTVLYTNAVVFNVTAAEEEEVAAEETEEEEAEEEPETETTEEEPAEEEEVTEEPEEKKEKEAEEPEIPVYEYERDEEGALVLDEKGNPIAIVGEGEEIPVAFLRDEEGNLILDGEGNPIATQTVPADAVIKYTLEDALNPERTIDIYYSWNNMKPAIGGEVTFIAVLNGYDNLEYSIQWQQSRDNSSWNDIAGGTGTRYTETVTRENYRDFWRVQVTITGVRE